MFTIGSVFYGVNMQRHTVYEYIRTENVNKNTKSMVLNANKYYENIQVVNKISLNQATKVGPQI